MRIRNAIAGVLGLAFMIWTTEAFSQVNFIEVKSEEEMDKAVSLAAESNKYLFVDVYATWCGPCKMMDRDVYPDSAVSAYLNGNYVSVHMDGETEFGSMYAATHQLRGFPTMFVFSQAEEKIGTIVGHRDPERLISELKGYERKYESLVQYRKDFREGSMEMDDFAAYLAAVGEMKNSREAGQVVTAYLEKKGDKEISLEEIRMLAPYTDLSHSLWKELHADPEKLKEAVGSNYMGILEKIYNNSLTLALERNDLTMVSRLSNELMPMFEAGSGVERDFRSVPFIQYYYNSGKIRELTSYVEDRYASDRKDDHGWLFEMTSQIVNMDQNTLTPDLLKKNEEWLKTCIESEETHDYYFYLGMVLFFQKKKEASIEALEKSLVFASNEEQKSTVDRALQYIRGN